MERTTRRWWNTNWGFCGKLEAWQLWQYTSEIGRTAEFFYHFVFYSFQGGQEVIGTLDWKNPTENAMELQFDLSIGTWSCEFFIASCPSSGTNLLLNGAHEFPPWADVRAEHADRGHEWMEKFSMDDIWRHHCIVPYVPRIFFVDWFRREMFDL